MVDGAATEAGHKYYYVFSTRLVEDQDSGD